MIVPNMYGKEPGSYAHGLVRCASSPQMQGLERQRPEIPNVRKSCKHRSRRSRSRFTS